MALVDEVYGEGRGSIVEQLLPYAAQRIASRRATAISEPHRFFVLYIGMFGCVCASTGYVYNLFSGRLQEKYSFSQTEMTTITTVANIIGLVSFPLASVYDYFGPAPLFVVSLLSFPTGAVLFGLAFADKIDGSVARFTVFNSLLGIGSGMFDIASLMTVMSVFPSSRGAVIAVMKTFIGLGSAIFGAIQLGFFESSVTGFFYFMAAFVVAVSVAGFAFIRLPPYQLTGYEERTLCEEEKRQREATKRAYFEQIPPARRFLVGFVVVGVLLVFLPTQSVLVAYWRLGHRCKMALAITTIVLMGSYIVAALPLRCLDGGSEAIVERAGTTADPDEDADASPSASARTNAYTEAEHITPQALVRASQQVSSIMQSTRGSIVENAVFSMPVVDEAKHISPQYQTSFLESIATAKMWALTYSLFCIVGAQMVIIMNARFVYAAVAEEDISAETTALLTVINGVGSALGRILMSAFEVWTQKREPEQRIPLTIALFIPTVSVLISTVLLLVVSRRLLLLPFVFTALGNGFTAATVVLTMRTMYAKDVANHYNFTSVASIASSIVLNKLLYGGWYTHQAEKQGGTLCKGRQCVAVPFIVMSLLVVSSFVSSAYVHKQYRDYCQSVYNERSSAQHAAPGRPPSSESTGTSETAPLLG